MDQNIEAAYIPMCWPILIRGPCNACAFLALAKKLITVRLVEVILDRGTPSRCRFRSTLPPAINAKTTNIN